MTSPRGNPTFGPRVGRPLGRALLENQVLADMAALAVSNHEYEDVVQAVLDQVERVVSSPFLALAVREWEQVGHHARAGEDVDPLWAAQVAAHVAETQRLRLSHPWGGQQVSSHRLTAPLAWLVSFSAETRSGRTAALTLAAAEPLTVSLDEERLMLRLVRQALLVLEHALLLGQQEELEPVDRLTGAASHRRLLETLDYELRRHYHAGRWLSVLLLDVEGLGTINRSYGHQYGNHILRSLAETLRHTVRPIDVVARLGEDELVVVLPETNEEEAQAISERLREQVLEMRFAGGAVNVSVCVAHARPGELLAVEELLRRAEQSLEEAKRQNKGWSALLQPQGRRA